VLVDVAQAIGTHAGDMEPVAIEFEAEMRQVKSMADGTYNVVLNVPEYCLPQVKEMMGWLKELVQAVMVKKA
jgi:hypothetical protein